MIRKLHLKPFIITIFSMLLVISCEKDDMVVNAEETPSNKSIYKIKTISHEEAAVNTSLSKTFDEISTILNPVAKSGTYYDAENDFYIYTDEVKHITVGEYESFTYSIKTRPEEKAIKNLFFSKVADGEYRSFLVTYDLSQFDLEAVLSGREIIHEDDVLYEEIRTDFFSKIETSGDCVSQQNLVHCDSDPDGDFYEWKEDGFTYTCTGYLRVETIILIDLDCVSGGGGGGTGGGGTGSGDTGGSNPGGDTGGGYPIGGGGGGGTCSDCPPPDSGSNDGQEPSDPDDISGVGSEQPVECLALDESGECIGDVTVLKPEPIDDIVIGSTNNTPGGNPYVPNDDDVFVLPDIPRTMTKQVGNTCVSSSIEYVASALGGDTTQKEIEDWFKDTFDIYIVLYGVTFDKVSIVVSQFLTTGSFIGVKEAIDAGNPYITNIELSRTVNADGSIAIDGHMVVIVGYHPNGDYIFMDPLAGALREAPPSSFPNDFSYGGTITGVR